jgi:glucoamylase
MIREGQPLRVCTYEPALVHCGVDGWQRASDIATQVTALGLHVADLPSAPLRGGQRLDFTFLWTRTNAWEGRNYRVDVRAALP